MATATMCASFSNISLFSTISAHTENDSSTHELQSSELFCYKSSNSLANCEPISWTSTGIHCPSPPPPTSAPNTTSTTVFDDRTRMFGTVRYKLMGLSSKEEAMRQLDTGTQAILFHDEDGRLLLAIQAIGKKFLLRVRMQIYSNGDRYWGIEGQDKKISVAFKNKERLLQFYAICPQSAIMSYFHL